MSKRKGISLDEKRMRMLQIFYEKKEFFTLKEIEKIAPKEKNIVVQSVKDVLQALVDDDLVRGNITATEEIIAETSKKIIEAEFRVQKLKEEIAEEKKLKSDSEEKTNLSQEVAQLRKEEQKLKEQIAKSVGVDPEAIAKMNEKAMEYKDVSNIWTDNIYAIQSWCKDKFGISKEDLNKQFNIPEELDYKE